ncbi:S-layer homology domain-containing protein [uncultured Intestinimonas sp.]|uniref:S-layer homology domain-containing protein n=1 Tax=uncultured Intestinimonas sp. TaxID=1689265 RepID=UPI002942F22C|nr:S-layer homology domain-containing protein [uncultured Intestinimonas sp.]
MKAKRVWSAVLCAGLALSMCVNAAATQNDELRAAASYVSEQGVMVGDQNGDMALDQTLSRTELAVILTRITVNSEHLEAEQELYTKKCEFPDVPEWARLYVGYLSFNGLMVGYDDGSFGAADLVTPAAACTVILRHLGYPESSGWDYHTACDKLISLGLAPSELAEKGAVTRGDMAILLYRAMRSPEGGAIGAGDSAAGDATENIPQEGAGSSASSRQGITYNTDGSINIPSDCSRYVPQAGDVIRCDDGSNYTITDVSRYDKNMFASGPVGDLPEPTCDWSLLEQPELPEAEARRYTDSDGDYLFVCNLYETRRMLYTLYNAIGDNPVTWKDGAPVLSSKGNQLVHIQLTIPEGESYQMFWPWRASEITNIFNSVPPGTYCMQAWDVFSNGIFQRTEYQIYTI